MSENLVISEEAEQEEDMVVCCDCGAVIPRSEALYSERTDRYYCSDCRVLCEHCGEPASSFDTYAVDDEEWCSSCTGRDAVYCDCCEAYHSYEQGSNQVFDTGECVCDQCASNYYHYCRECDNLVSRDSWNDDEDCCESCAQERIEAREREDEGESYSNRRVDDYHSHCYSAVGSVVPLPDGCKDLNGVPLNERLRHLNGFVGLELEVGRNDGDRDSDADAAAIKELNKLQYDGCAAGRRLYFYEYDGSVSTGFEIITDPLSMETMRSAYRLDSFLAALRSHGYVSHDCKTDECGLHIHVSRSMFSWPSDSSADEMNDRIARLMFMYEVYYQFFYKASRRNARQRRNTESEASWARPYCSQTDGSSDRDVTIDWCKREIRRSRSSFSHGDRYKAVNIYNQHAPTIEFRLGKGTLNADSYRAWVDLHLNLIANCVSSITDENVLDMREWLRGIRPETLEYLNARKAFQAIEGFDAGSIELSPAGGFILFDAESGSSTEINAIECDKE